MKYTAWLLATLLVMAFGTASGQVATFNTLPVLRVATTIPGSTHIPGDFNRDGVSDLLWFNPTTNQLAYWLMQVDGATGMVTRIGSKTFNITPGYFVGAVGDFKSDGYADLVWTSANRDLYFWISNGSGGFSSIFYGTYPAGWQLFGAGDVDGDGYDDLLWVNPSACQFAYWLMKGTQRIGYRIISYTCGYYPLSIGYYTPSNRITIVWTSAAQDLYAWDSQGTSFLSSYLGNYSTFSAIPSNLHINLIGFGGGTGGAGIGMIALDQYGNYMEGDVLNRVFDSNGLQTSYNRSQVFYGGQTATGTAGYLIDYQGTGLIYQSLASSWVGVCPDANANALSSGAVPISCAQRYGYPEGWYVIGAMVNGVTPLTSP